MAMRRGLLKSGLGRLGLVQRPPAPGDYDTVRPGALQRVIHRIEICCLPGAEPVLCPACGDGRFPLESDKGKIWSSALECSPANELHRVCSTPWTGLVSALLLWHGGTQGLGPRQCMLPPRAAQPIPRAMSASAGSGSSPS